MKKTIIALAALALASVASAADYTFTVPTGGNFYAGDYTFEFMIFDEADVSTSGTTLAAYYGGSKGDTYGQNWYTLTNTDGNITLTVGRGNGSTYQDNKTFTGLETGVVYTVSNVGADQSQTVTLTGGDINSTVNYAGNMNGGDADTTMTVTFNQTFAVPEPATATLSLLALAGLAARRRRK